MKVNRLSKWKTMTPMERVKEALLYTGMYLLLLLVAVVILYPVVWIVGSAFNEGSSLASSTAIPRHPTLQNFVRLFEETDYKKWYMNTFMIAILNTIVSVVLTGTMDMFFLQG